MPVNAQALMMSGTTLEVICVQQAAAGSRDRQKGGRERAGREGGMRGCVSGAEGEEHTRVYGVCWGYAGDADGLCGIEGDATRRRRRGKQMQQ